MSESLIASPVTVISWSVPANMTHGCRITLGGGDGGGGSAGGGDDGDGGGTAGDGGGGKQTEGAQAHG